MDGVSAIKTRTEVHVDVEEAIHTDFSTTVVPSEPPCLNARECTEQPPSSPRPRPTRPSKPVTTKDSSASGLAPGEKELMGTMYVLNPLMPIWYLAPKLQSNLYFSDPRQFP